MNRVGIEYLNFYGGSAYIDVKELFEARELDVARFDNLMLYRKSVGMPWEDSVSNAVNAAKPIIDQLSVEERGRIELVITASESGLDFGKSMSTYIHDLLGLDRNCRLYEVKQACFGGTAALEAASTFVASGMSPGAKALVLATDVVYSTARGTYVEPSQGVGAVAMLVGDEPEVLDLDFQAYGSQGYEVMDTCRPLANLETGDADLSLLSYLDCLDKSYANYAHKVQGADFASTFDYLAFHTPFAGMVKGGHRKMMRDLYAMKTRDIDADFQVRVAPSLRSCGEVGNVYSATLYLALSSLITHAAIDAPKRVGLFSYGSGCSSKFFSGIVTPESQRRLRAMRVQERLDERHRLSMAEYDQAIDLNAEWGFGVQNKDVNLSAPDGLYAEKFEGSGLLVLDRVRGFHREYRWA